MTPRRVVIIGAGQAGVGAAGALRELAFDGAVTVVGRELHPPYQRPPLSKALLIDDDFTEQGLRLRAEQWYQDKGIELLLGRDVEEIDRTCQSVRLDDGQQIPYDHLILATGARTRKLTLSGGHLGGVLALRDLDDARMLRRGFDDATSLLAVGAGFIGLEVAAAASSRGLKTTVVDVAMRVMERAVTPTISAHLSDAQRVSGTTLLLNTGIAGLRGTDGRVSRAVTTAGEVLPVDLVVIAVGVQPNVELAGHAGLDVANGIVVDEHLRTSDPNIFAIGDCAWFTEPISGRGARLESVQAAIDHARSVAAQLTGRVAPYTAVPWFWTHQGKLKLQIAGLGGDIDDEVVRGNRAGSSFSVFGYRDGMLATVESINRPADHIAARRMLAARVTPAPDDVADPGFDLKAFATRATARTR